MKFTTRFLLVAFLALPLSQAWAEELAVFSCTEYAERDWPRMLVGYDCNLAQGKAQPGQVRVVNGKDQEIPSQLAGISLHKDGSLKTFRLHLYAELAKGASYRFRLLKGKPTVTVKDGVTLKRGRSRMIVASPQLAVELPALGEKSYKTPIDAAKVAAPIQRFRLHNGQWAGKGELKTTRRVTATSQKLVAEGPLFVETAYRLTFAPEGHYTMRVRVEKEGSMVHVAEEFDLGAALPNENNFVLNLSQGWKPTKSVWTSYRKPGGAKQLMHKCAFHGVGTWEQAIDLGLNGEHRRISCFQDFGTRAVWYGVTGEDRSAPYVGYMSMHAGAWRLDRPAQGQVTWSKEGVKLRLPLNPYLQGSPQNPFNTGEIDPDLPSTLGRRHWALIVEPRPTDEKGKYNPKPHYVYRRYNGSINLNDYKDWILDWPDKGASYPRLLGNAKSIARLKANLDKCPNGEALKNHYLISRKDEDVKRPLGRVKSEARHKMNAFDCYVPHFRQFTADMGFLFPADTVLAWPKLPAADRKRIRAQMAIGAYLQTNANFLPRGAGVHLGNPNMAINRTVGIALYGRMLPDHPMAKTWMDDAARYVKWSISHDVTPAGGQFRECPGYATYGPTVFLTIAAAALRDAGYDLDDFQPLKDMGQWFIDVATAPTGPRGWKCKHKILTHKAHIGDRKMRVLPGFGNGRDIPGGQMPMLLAGLFAESDPAFASRLMGASHEAGFFLGTEATGSEMWFYWNPDIKPTPPKYSDAVVSGFGGVLRAHPGKEELTAQLRQGYMQSHWNPDQGCFVLYARGQCIAPPTGWMYSSPPKGANHDSLISFGEELAGHEHGRVDTLIRDYGFTPSAGYIDGVQTYKRNLGKLLKTPFDWNRQVMMVRNKKPSDPNYVILRDTMHGATLFPSWWYQWLYTTADKVKPIAGGLRARFPGKVIVDILFLHADKVKASVMDATFREFDEEKYCQIKINRPAGKDYFVLFYPYKEGEPAPKKAEQLAPGVARITTATSEDYVFLSADAPIHYEDKKVAFDGHAGLIRVQGRQADMVNASSQNAAMRYLKAEQKGFGPWEVRAQGAKAKMVQAAPSRAAVAEPEGKTVTAITPEMKATDGASGTGLTGWVAVDGDTVTLVAASGLGTIRHKDFYVTGEAPFTCVKAPGKITLEAKGRRRIFLMPIPESLLPAGHLPPKESLPEWTLKNMTVNGWINWPIAPAMEIGGNLVQGGWYDGVMAVGLDEKASTVTITPWTNPSVWRKNATTRLLPVPEK
ncbi:MAG: hypothetical protein ACYTGH_11035 [Planctomycetota bacterium]